MFKRINLNLDLSKFLLADYEIHKGSCITHQKKELTDIHHDYGGFPLEYNEKNTEIQQLWWTENDVDFDYIGHCLEMDVVTISSILQKPGNAIPIHRDTFFQITQKFPNDTRRKVRANIYVTDWQMGHIIQYKNKDKWENDINWKSGQGLLWDSSILHLSANVGFRNKITLQISGFYND